MGKAEQGAPSARFTPEQAASKLTRKARKAAKTFLAAMDSSRSGIGRRGEDLCTCGHAEQYHTEEPRGPQQPARCTICTCNGFDWDPEARNG